MLKSSSLFNRIFIGDGYFFELVQNIWHLELYLLKLQPNPPLLELEADLTPPAVVGDMTDIPPGLIYFLDFPSF